MARRPKTIEITVGDDVAGEWIAMVIVYPTTKGDLKGYGIYNRVGGEAAGVTEEEALTMIDKTTKSAMEVLRGHGRSN